MSDAPPRSEGRKSSFSLRIAKLPVILGQAKIFDCFGTDEFLARNKMQENILDVLKRATAVGSERVVQQMTKALVKM